MIRYTVFVLTVLGTAVTAIANVAPAKTYTAGVTKNISIFYKSNGTPLVLEQCAKEDCSDTPSNS
jgi:hypothetical protein